MNRVSPLLSLFSFSELLKQTLTALVVCSCSSLLSTNLQNPGRYKANKLPLLILLSCSHPVRAHSISDARAKERKRERLAGLGCKLFCWIRVSLPRSHRNYDTLWLLFHWLLTWSRGHEMYGRGGNGFTVSRIFRASFQRFLLCHCDTLAVAFTLGHPFTWNLGPRTVRAVETGSLFHGYLASLFFHSN